jgi:putative DNA methylase
MDDNRDQKIIEYLLPLKEIGIEASKEKFVRSGHLSSLHIWWSRKPLIAARLSILGSLINKPESEKELEELFEIMKKVCSWKGGLNKKLVESTRKIIRRDNNSIPKVLDSFAGGGSIPLEALRLGCDAYSLDLNPVAHIIQICALKYPQEAGRKSPKIEIKDTKLPLFSLLANDVMYYGKFIHKRVYNLLNKFYQSKDNEIIHHYLWCRTIRCPNPSCERIAPLMKNFWLSKKKNMAFKFYDTKSYFKLQIIQNPNFSPDIGTVSQGNFSCPYCNQVADVSYVRKEGQKNRLDNHLVAICYSTKDSVRLKRFREPTPSDLRLIEDAKKEFKNNKEKFGSSFIPNEVAPRKGSGPQRFFSYSNYGFHTFDTLFTKRQGIVLGTLIREINMIYEKIIEEKEDELQAKAIVTCLSLVLGRMTDLNCNLTSWRASDGGIRNLFERPTISMKWGFGEPNPLGKKTGSWINTLKVVASVIEECSKVSNKGANVDQGSATLLPYENDFFDVVSIDPPYYDYIIYSDNSDFFYVWFKRVIGKLYPDIFATPLTPKSMEIIHNRHRHNNDEIASKRFYEENMKKSFEEIRRVLKPDGIAVIMFTHRSTSAWESLLSSIVNAGLTVTASWPLQTEMGSRLQSVGRKGQATVGSTIFLICRKRKSDAKVGYYQEIREDMTLKINKKLKLFWNNGIVGSDFFISAIGPGMEIFSKYKHIEDFSGKIISIEELLDQISSITTNYIINELLKQGSDSNIDNLSQFYLTFRWSYLDSTVDYDEARKLANSSGIILEDLWSSSDSFVRKTSKKISLLGPMKRKFLGKPVTFVDTMHKAVSLWSKGHKEDLEDFLKTNEVARKQSFWQFCQAVSECLLVGNKEKQMIDGFLLSRERYLQNTGNLKNLGRKGKTKNLGDYYKKKSKSEKR